MTKEQVKNLKLTELKRLCGVSKDTFKDMVTVLEAEKILPKKTGRPNKLSAEEQLLNKQLDLEQKKFNSNLAKERIFIK